MAKYDVIILTDSRYVDPEDPDQYTQNILTEDSLVRKALEEKGFIVERRSWSDPEFEWKETLSVLFRTNWDYFDRFAEFYAWTKRISDHTQFINSIDLLNWNIDKHYLEDLGNKKVPIIPTRFIPRGSLLTLSELHNLTGWNHTVVKPAIGGAARHTFQITQRTMNEVEEHLKPLMKEEDFMLQPFQYSIPDEGEVSLMIFGGAYSHAVLKKAKAGDFRVQDDFGGTVHDHIASKEEIELGLQAVEACPEKPAYARVDIMKDNDGNLAVSELELIEPELWFRRKPESAKMMAEAVVDRLQQ
ncbi:RimK family alpha-L-glutamate ligase [Gracilimonas sp. Q87]|uniref:ATP-grasp domain-containing protein n=1 Tax=Gracilimonas sp. Q87 TaxID=3384766 RepID=UPI0039844B33